MKQRGPRSKPELTSWVGKDLSTKKKNGDFPTIKIVAEKKTKFTENLEPLTWFTGGGFCAKETHKLNLPPAYCLARQDGCDLLQVKTVVWGLAREGGLVKGPRGPRRTRHQAFGGTKKDEPCRGRHGGKNGHGKRAVQNPVEKENARNGGFPQERVATPGNIRSDKKNP